ALVIAWKDRAGDEHALFGGFGFHRLLALKGSKAGGFGFRVGALLLLEGGEPREGRAAGGIGGRRLPLGPVGAGSCLSLRSFAFASETLDLRGGPARFLFGGRAGNFGGGLLGTQAGEIAFGLLGSDTRFLGGEPVSLGFGGSTLAGLGLAAFEV